MYTYDENTGVWYRTADGLIVQPQLCTQKEFEEYSAWTQAGGKDAIIIPLAEL